MGLKRGTVAAEEEEEAEARSFAEDAMIDEDGESAPTGVQVCVQGITFVVPTVVLWAFGKSTCF